MIRMSSSDLKISFSNKCQVDQTRCIIEINFHNVIDFKYLTIVKRQRLKEYDEFEIEQSYHNVCLILDDDRELCTTNGYGFDVKSNSPPYEIDFILPKRNVQKIQLHFRQLEPLNKFGNYRAAVADLKIHYRDPGKSYFKWL